MKVGSSSSHRTYQSDFTWALPLKSTFFQFRQHWISICNACPWTFYNRIMHAVHWGTIEAIENISKAVSWRRPPAHDLSLQPLPALDCMEQMAFTAWNQVFILKYQSLWLKGPLKSVKHQVMRSQTWHHLWNVLLCKVKIFSIDIFPFLTVSFSWYIKIFLSHICVFLKTTFLWHQVHFWRCCSAH